MTAPNIAADVATPAMLIGLDEPGCLLPEHTGAKAARLARARAAGLPVLPGFVVPVAAGAQALGRGLVVLEADSRHAGQLQVMTAGTPEPLAAELRVRAAVLGAQVVVRSSSAVEGDLRWAGAFTSFLGVAPEHVPVAVAGCWASALGRDALERCQELGVAPAQLALAVLVQPEIQPVLAGTASIDADGAVRVVSVEGSPAQLMAGWDPAVVTTVPTTARPTIRGRGSGGPRRLGRGADPLDETALYAVADLVRAVHATLGDDTIEWALHDGGVVLLQSSSGEPAGLEAPRPAVPNGRRDRRRGLPPSVLPVARLAHRYGGTTGDALVLPWALALPGVPTAPAARHGDLASAWRQAREIAAELTAAVWQARPDAAAAHAAETLSELRGASSGRAPRRALRRIAELSPIDPRRARRVLELLEAVADGLARGNRLAAAAEFWSLAPEQVTALIDGTETGAVTRVGRAAGRAPGRVAGPWEPFVHAAVITHGHRTSGIPAAAGTAAGVAQLIGEDGTVGPTGGRSIWVTERPLPQFAPLLWHAAGLVTAGGSPAAHLVQVARSLHVPAVVGCDLTTLRGGNADDRPRLVAIDGDTGTIAVTEATP